MSLAERTKIALERSGKKKIDVEREAELPKGYMTRIIDGARKSLGPDMMARLADALGVEYQWLATGDGKAEAPRKVLEDASGFSEVVEATSPIEYYIAAFPWPPELEPEDAQHVVKQIRQEHFKTKESQLPGSYWLTRMKRLVDEALGRAKDAPKRPPVEDVDLTEESPEIRAARKRPKKL